MEHQQEHILFANTTQLEKKRTRQDAGLDDNDSVAEDIFEQEEQTSVQPPPLKKTKIDEQADAQQTLPTLSVEEQFANTFILLNYGHIDEVVQFAMNHPQWLRAYDTNDLSNSCGITGLMALIKSTDKNGVNLHYLQEFALTLLSVLDSIGSHDTDTVAKNTVLHYLAKYHGLAQMVPHFQNCQAMRNAINDDGLTPLHVAIHEHNWPVVELLLQSSTFDELNTMYESVAKLYLPFRGTLVHFFLFHSIFLNVQDLHLLERVLERADLTQVTTPMDDPKYDGLNSLMLAIMCCNERIALLVFQTCNATLDADLMQLLLQTESRDMNARQLCDRVGNMENVAMAIANKL